MVKLAECLAKKAGEIVFICFKAAGFPRVAALSACEKLIFKFLAGCIFLYYGIFYKNFRVFDNFVTKL